MSVQCFPINSYHLMLVKDYPWQVLKWPRGDLQHLIQHRHGIVKPLMTCYIRIQTYGPIQCPKRMVSVYPVPVERALFSVWWSMWYSLQAEDPKFYIRCTHARTNWAWDDSNAFLSSPGVGSKKFFYGSYKLLLTDFCCRTSPGCGLVSSGEQNPLSSKTKSDPLWLLKSNSKAVTGFPNKTWPYCKPG